MSLPALHGPTTRAFVAEATRMDRVRFLNLEIDLSDCGSEQGEFPRSKTREEAMHWLVREST